MNKIKCIKSQGSNVTAVNLHMPDYLKLLHPLLEHSNAVSFVYDLAAQRPLYVSAAYEQVIGDPITHIHEDLPLLLGRVHADDWQLLQQRLVAAALNELVQDVEVRLARANGSWQWLCLTAGRVPGPGELEYLVGAVRDITRDKEVMFNAHKFNTKKNATLEILAHDLATPLVLLQQLSEQLSWEINSPSDTAQELLRLMQRTCTQGVNLIHDFVDHEFLTSSEVELKRERADLVAWLRLLLEEYQRSEQHLKLEFKLVSGEQPIYVSFDVNKLQQVFNNLISNAIKFTPDGGSITVSVERRSGLAQVSVADTGVGIPAHLQPVLFDKFTKARRPGLRGERTTGLGMSVIKTILNLHQASIRFDSVEGQGTTFYLELPAMSA